MHFLRRYKKKDLSYMLTFHPIIDDLEQVLLPHSGWTPAGHSVSHKFSTRTLLMLQMHVRPTTAIYNSRAGHAVGAAMNLVTYFA